MQTNTARWAQLVMMDREDVEALHARERSLATRSGPSRQPLCAQQNRHWKCAGLIADAMRRRGPSYWPAGMDQTEQGRSIEQFEREIYPIWASIKTRHRTAEASMSLTDCADQNILAECVTLHAQDLAIYESGIKPAMTTADQTKMADLRRRAARAAGAGA